MKTFSYLLCILTHDLRDWVYYFQMLQCFKYLKTGRTLPSDSLNTLATSFWVQILKLKTLHLLQFIPNYH